MKTVKCWECNSEMIEKEKEIDNISYNYFNCPKCGDEIVTMDQLHELVEKQKKMKKHFVKVSKWGQSLAIRIPKALVKKYKLKANKEVNLLPEKNAIKIISGT